MSHVRVAVSWTPFKRRYDLVMIALVLAFLASFVGVGLALFPRITLEILLIRAFGAAAIALLHFILILGPLARVDGRWIVLLSNRRHLGVLCFLLALVHGVLATLTYHAGGDIDPLLSIFVSDAGARASAFPFQAFGFVALLVLFVMAASSHDFWLAALTAPVWKALHMLVYPAWLALIVHVTMGVLQSETHPAYVALTAGGILTVSGLHLWAGWNHAKHDRGLDVDGDFVDVCGVENLIENRPLGITLAGDRVAVVRFKGDRVAAVSGVCQHQNGPLAEGRYLDGCLTCPWHGFQYRMEDGCAPEPFTEKLPVFRVRIERGRVLVHPRPLPAGTVVEPAYIGRNRGCDRAR